ncbi:tetratricopeptide-like helical domain-containing protein [Artemisia annua]|uniref:Tetratricopeptide-like helical domain-containing protein n=1 Tax=Artemisia annua TaxID=35608 RepID=A0A2U1KJQ7_ARTAN|nr:tetratricopeptide-like helical domain-containing protein [Artemisia annua]
MTELGYEGEDLFVCLCKSGSLMDASNVFDEMHEKYLCSWNTMVSRYAKAGRVDDARTLFDEMVERNNFSWTMIISSYQHISLDVDLGSLDKIDNPLHHSGGGAWPDGVLVVEVERMDPEKTWTNAFLLCHERMKIGRVDFVFMYLRFWNVPYDLPTDLLRIIRQK